MAGTGAGQILELRASLLSTWATFFHSLRCIRSPDQSLSRWNRSLHLHEMMALQVTAQLPEPPHKFQSPCSYPNVKAHYTIFIFHHLSQFNIAPFLKILELPNADIFKGISNFMFLLALWFSRLHFKLRQNNILLWILNWEKKTWVQGHGGHHLTSENKIVVTINHCFCSIIKIEFHLLFYRTKKFCLIMEIVPYQIRFLISC